MEGEGKREGGRGLVAGVTAASSVKLGAAEKGEG
jgi:hypothetical protein